ncbi:MAG: T9SS type A sorting domain-containing protein, partial [Bacteroidota bacterium]
LDNISIQVEPSVAYLPIPYFQDFETAVYEQEYRISSEQAIDQTTLAQDPTQLTRFYLNEVFNTVTAVSGTYAVRLGKSSDSEGDNVNAFDLHLNLAGESQVQLSYWITSFFDELQVDDGIWLSVDAGQTFTKVFNFGLDTMANNVWRFQSLDLSALAAANGLIFSDSTILRFQQFGVGDFSTSGAEDGLLFDDISLNCSSQTADFSFSVDCSTLQVDFTDLSQGTNLSTSYAWDFDGDGLIDTVGNGDISHIYSSTGTFEVTLYVGNQDGCGDSITQQVFIGSSVPPPALDVVGPIVDLCEGDTLTVTAQIGYQGYLWNNGAATQSLEITTPGIYSVQGLGIDGCFSTPTEIEVIGRPAPLAPFLSLVGEPTFCEGGSVDLVAPFGATAYQWNTGDTTQSITVTASGTYEVRIANGFGCLSPAADTVITVFPTPATPSISQAAGSSWLSSSEMGETYQWFLDGILLNVDSMSIDASVFGEGDYTVQVSNGPCASDFSDAFAFSSTSVTSLIFESLEIAPNPSSGTFQLLGQQAEARSLSFQVFNSLGQAVSPKEQKQVAPSWKYALNLEYLPEGVYLLRIESNQQAIYQRLLLQK